MLSGHRPQLGAEKQHNVNFWRDLEGLEEQIPISEKIILGEDKAKAFEIL
jgi:hypothetical protein